MLDVVLAFGTWILWRGFAFLWGYWFGSSSAAAVARWMPKGFVESAFWALLSISAGFVEELVFRGYLQRQLTAFTGRASVAFFLQTAVFGVTHAYQGVRSGLMIASYGALFTLLALWRKSLRPGMMAHAWTDIAGGLLR